jgi:hypothetical protein
MISSDKIPINVQLPSFGLPCHDHLTLAPPPFCTDGVVLTLRSDIPGVTESLLAERLGLLMNNCLAASMLCGDQTVRPVPGGPISLRKHSLRSFLPTTVWYWGKEIFRDKQY